MVVDDKLGVVKLFPVANTMPPVGKSYQPIVPAEATAFSVTDPLSHLEAEVVLVILEKFSVVLAESFNSGSSGIPPYSTM